VEKEGRGEARNLQQVTLLISSPVASWKNREKGGESQGPDQGSGTKEKKGGKDRLNLLNCFHNSFWPFSMGGKKGGRGK